MKIDLLHLLPFLSSIVMSVTAVATYRGVRGRTGKFLAGLALICALWALFIFLEYLSQEIATLSHPERISDYLPVIRSMSALAGFFSQAIPWVFLILSLHFPPRTANVRLWTALAIVSLILFGLISPFGLVFEIAEGRIVRTQTIVMRIQSVSFYTALAAGFLLLLQKHSNYTSRLRKFQIRWFGAGVILPALGGGFFAFVYPNETMIVLLTTVAPPFFIVTVFAGLMKARFLKGGRPPLPPDGVFPADVGPDERMRSLKERGYDVTLYRQSSGFIFLELAGHDQISIPAGLLKPGNIFYWEDFDDTPDREEYMFLRRNYAEAGMVLAGNHETLLALIHSVPAGIVSERDLQFVKRVLV